MESVVAFRPGAKIRLQVLVDSGRAVGATEVLVSRLEELRLLEHFYFGEGEFFDMELF